MESLTSCAHRILSTDGNELPTPEKKQSGRFIYETLKKALWQGTCAATTIYLIPLPITGLQIFTWGVFGSIWRDRLDVLPDDLVMEKKRQTVPFRVVVLAFKVLISMVIGRQLLLHMGPALTLAQVLVLTMSHEFLDFGGRSVFRGALRVVHACRFYFSS